MNSFLGFVDGIKEKQLTVLLGMRELIKDADIKRIAYNGVAFVLGAALSRCGIMDAIYPFGQGYFVCMLMYSAYYKAAFFGCVIGWLTLFPKVPFGALLVAAICMGAVPVARYKYKVEKTRLLKVVYILFSFVGVLIFSLNGRYFTIVGVCEAIVAIMCLFIYDKTANALFVRKKRSRLTDDEAICLVFCLCTLVIFAGGMKIYAFEVGLIVAGILTMGFGYIFGSTVGAAAGVVCGLCVSLGGGSIYTIGSMGVCGFFCGLINKNGRIFSIAAYIVTNGLLTLYINGSSFVILPIQNTLVSAAVIMLLPKAWVDQIREILYHTVSKSKEEHYYIEKYNSLAKEKIDNLSRLFNTMSELFFTASAIKQRGESEISSIIRDGAGEACKNCIRYKVCWQDEFLATFGGFEEMAGEIIAGKTPKGKIYGCINEDIVISALKQTVDTARVNERHKADKDDGNELLSLQFSGVSRMLTELSGQVNSDVRFESEIERNIKDELTLFDIGVYDVCVMNVSGAYRCQLELKSCSGNLDCKYKVQKTVSKFCGKPMVLSSSLCAGGKSQRCKLEFNMAKPLKVTSFVVQSSKEDVCGDSYRIGYINEGEYMLCLSDGMGSGKEAREESLACVDLLGSFFKAGFNESVVFSTVNKLLMLKSDTEIFTTVDLCMVDLIRSRMCFTKIGSVPSVLIKKSRGACVIRGDSLPLGILDEVNEKSFQMDVEDGDILIMFTDGVYDTMCSDGSRIENAILDTIGDSVDIKEITSLIMDRCNLLNDGEKKDDMTILISMFKSQHGRP